MKEGFEKTSETGKGIYYHLDEPFVGCTLDSAAGLFGQMKVLKRDYIIRSFATVSLTRFSHKFETNNIMINRNHTLQ